MLQDGNWALGVAFGTAALGATALYFAKPKKNNDAPLPPGPPGTFILGNTADLPQSQPWLRFTEWAKTYGPIVHLGIFGKSIIILNDPNVATAMLDKKSRIYSNRPNLIMGGNLVGWDEGPALIQFGKKWSEYRRLIAQFLGTRTKIETAYNNILDDTAHSFLNGLLQSPSMWKEHGARFAAAIVLKVSYGYEAQGENDPLVKLVDDAMTQFSEVTGANAFAVDTFPLLRFVPEWFPGAGWKKKIRPYHTTLQTMLDTPFDMVKRQMQMGSSPSCVVSELLDSHQFAGHEAERIVKWTAAAIYSGGAETTAAVIETFFLALVLHPDAQRRAQAELDTVLGPCTAPRSADRPRLPYVEALLCEVLRKYSIGPLGLPHSAAEDDIQDGFFIPKDAIIITNNWLFYRDPNTYSDPETFQPERFLETPTHSKEKDPKDVLFGYGRRACPGVHLADMSMWLLFASVLAFFDIGAPIKDGHPIFPSDVFSDGSISRPAHFEYAITPRNGAAEAIRRLVDV